MGSFSTFNIAVLAVISTYHMIFPVNGQCTVQGCASGDSSINIVEEIHQLFVEFHERLQAIDQRLQEQEIYIKQVQDVHGSLNVSLKQMNDLNSSLQQMNDKQDTIMTSLQAVDQRLQEQLQGMINLNASFQQMNDKQDTIMTSLQAVDRRSQEQLQGMRNLNASFQQMNNKQDTVMTSLEVIDRRSQEQNIYMKQVQSVHELLNISHQESETKHDTALKRFEAIDRRFIELDITMKNESQNAWKLAIDLHNIAVGIDLARGPVLPPIIDNWITIMKRFDGSIDFNRNWIEYKNGFGDIERGEFWLGNEKIHRLTNRFFYRPTLRIEVQLKANGAWYYADYSTFSIDSENNKYTLRLSGYSGGNAGDSLTNTTLPSDGFSGGMNFTTLESDNDRDEYNCASSHGGGWWFSKCHWGCLTCRYNSDPFRWRTANSNNVSDGDHLRAARMMIRSK